METTNNNKTVVHTFTLEKLGCSGCANSVERILNKMDGVIKATATFKPSAVTVEYNPDIVSPTDMRTAVQNGGYDMIIN